jgi:hypothetical protein
MFGLCDSVIWLVRLLVPYRSLLPAHLVWMEAIDGR